MTDIDAFEQILEQRKRIAKKEDSLDESRRAYYTGVQWGLTMALQILDYPRWLDWYLDSVEISRGEGANAKAEQDFLV